MTIYGLCGNTKEFICEDNNGITISYAHADKQTFPIEAPEEIYIKWIDKTGKNGRFQYNVGDNYLATKHYFITSSRSQFTSTSEAIKLYNTIQSAHDFYKEGTKLIYSDGYNPISNFKNIQNKR